MAAQDIDSPDPTPKSSNCTTPVKWRDFVQGCFGQGRFRKAEVTRDFMRSVVGGLGSGVVGIMWEVFFLYCSLLSFHCRRVGGTVVGCGSGVLSWWNIMTPCSCLMGVDFCVVSGGYWEDIEMSGRSLRSTRLHLYCWRRCLRLVKGEVVSWSADLHRWGSDVMLPLTAGGWKQQGRCREEGIGWYAFRVNITLRWWDLTVLRFRVVRGVTFRALVVVVYVPFRVLWVVVYGINSPPMLGPNGRKRKRDTFRICYFRSPSLTAPDGLETLLLPVHSDVLKAEQTWDTALLKSRTCNSLVLVFPCSKKSPILNVLPFSTKLGYCLLPIAFPISSVTPLAAMAKWHDTNSIQRKTNQLCESNLNTFIPISYLAEAGSQVRVFCYI